MRKLSASQSHALRPLNSLYCQLFVQRQCIQRQCIRRLCTQLLRGRRPSPHLDATLRQREARRASSTLGPLEGLKAKLRDIKLTINDDVLPYMQATQNANQRAKVLLELLGPKKPQQIHHRSSRPAAHYHEYVYPDNLLRQDLSSKWARMTEESLSIGRKLMKECRDMHIIRCTLRRLFDQCLTCTEIVRVFAMAAQYPLSAKCLRFMSMNIVRAFYRARESNTDAQIYATCYALIKRLEMEGFPSDKQFYALCVKFAARSRDPEAMRKALWLYRSRNVALSSVVFRTIIAKFGIGRHGFGELRNGKWRRRDLLAVLFGFPGTPSGSPSGSRPDHHLASFLQREEWGFLSAWVQILGHAQAKDALFREWEIWHAHKHERKQCSRFRDEHFVQYMLLAGDVPRAWRILEESRLDFWTLHPERRSKLLDDPDQLNLSISALHDRESFEHAMIEKYARGLRKVEQRLGVVWVPDGKGGGWHRPALDMTSRWEELGMPPEEYSRKRRTLGDRMPNFPETDAI